MSTASASSRVRMPSSRSASSSCCCALFCCERTASRRWRRRAMSARIRSRSVLRGVWAVRAKKTMTAMKLRLELAQCMLRRLLLRLFLRRPLAAPREAPHLHLDDEALVVIGADLVDHAVLRQRQPLPLRQLLQRGLVIVEEEIVGVDAVDVVVE